MLFFCLFVVVFLLGTHFFETETLVLRHAFKWPYFHSKINKDSNIMKSLSNDNNFQPGQMD